VIPTLVEVLERLGLDRRFLAVGFAAVLTVLVLVAPSVARFFRKRNP